MYKRQVEDATADIVVIGGGGAGLSAAIEAADAGTEKIIVLEKMLNTGGTTATAQGMIAGYETKVQKASKDEPITYDAMVATLMNNALWKLDPALTQITVESSGQTIDWQMCIRDRIKCKHLLDDDYVICGYIPKEKGIVSLVLAQYDAGQLVYCCLLYTSNDIILKTISPSRNGNSFDIIPLYKCCLLYTSQRICRAMI